MAADDVEEEEFESSTRQKKKPTKEEEKRLLRKKKLLPGSLMKGIIRSGEDAFGNPKDGDQVIIHWAIRTVEGALVQSTRSEHGGKGTPIRYVLGKSNMLLGLSEGIPTMVKGEVAMFKMKPEVHYGEVDCPVAIPEDFPKEAELHFEIELLDFFKVKVINEDLGVVKRIIDEGQGWETPREPYEVKARITARSLDGRLILKQTQEPFFLTMGKGEVPKGVEMGMGTMTKGEKAVIYISSPYLTPSPFMTLTEEEMQFEVDLLHFIQVRDMLGDGRLIKRRIVDGRGDFPMDCPLQDSLLRVHYKGMLLDEERTVFYSTKTDNDGQPLEFSSGEGLVPEGLEMCVRLMLPGEVALLTCPPDYAYDKFTRGRPAGVPEGAHVQWEIELVGFEMPKDWTGLSFQEIMDEADKIKYTGNRLFKEGKFELAKAKYEKVLRDYNHVNPQDDEEGKIFLNSRNSLHLNVAACYQKMGEYKKSTEACNKVLDGSPAHVKALYRRGMSYMLGGYFDEARTDFKMMITVDKSSEADATAALLKLKQKEQDAEKKARKQFKGLFDKKPGEISDVGSEDRNQVKETDKGEAAVEQENHNSEMLDDDRDQEPEKVGLFSRLWPTSRRIFTSLGIHRCTIL